MPLNEPQRQLYSLRRLTAHHSGNKDRGLRWLMHLSLRRMIIPASGSLCLIIWEKGNYQLLPESMYWLL
ncbi:hypothetical protein AYX14_03850 [Cryptococcus neoformans]|nr:hypothetical protein AYX14_03850 [Cryptococcus neoformans var. grubii]